MALYDDIKALFTLPTAYEDWTEYRKRLTDYLIAETNHVALPLSFSANMDEDSLLPTLAIIGAGACNDLDLAELLNHFSKITLMDYDQNAMHTALATYHLENCPYIECKMVSLNGLQDVHYESFCNALQGYVHYNADNFSPAQFQQFALTQMNNILSQVNDYDIPLAPQSYDYICCFGVHSQLQAMFSYIYHVFEVNLKELYFHGEADFHDEITKRLQCENETFIPKLHNTLLAGVRQALFIGLEQKRTNVSGAIEGAYQAFQDIQSRSIHTEETTMTWPFLPQKHIEYEMSILKLMPSSEISRHT